LIHKHRQVKEAADDGLLEEAVFAAETNPMLEGEIARPALQFHRRSGFVDVLNGVDALSEQRDPGAPPPLDGRGRTCPVYELAHVHFQPASNEWQVLLIDMVWIGNFGVEVGCYVPEDLHLTAIVEALQNLSEVTIDLEAADTKLQQPVVSVVKVG